MLIYMNLLNLLSKREMYFVKKGDIVNNYITYIVFILCLYFCIIYYLYLYCIIMYYIVISLNISIKFQILKVYHFFKKWK